MDVLSVLLNRKTWSGAVNLSDILLKIYLTVVTFQMRKYVIMNKSQNFKQDRWDF